MYLCGRVSGSEPSTAVDEARLTAGIWQWVFAIHTLFQKSCPMGHLTSYTTQRLSQAAIQCSKPKMNCLDMCLVWWSGNTHTASLCMHIARPSHVAGTGFPPHHQLHWPYTFANPSSHTQLVDQHSNYYVRTINTRSSFIAWPWDSQTHCWGPVGTSSATPLQKEANTNQLTFAHHTNFQVPCPRNF